MSPSLGGYFCKHCFIFHRNFVSKSGSGYFFERQKVESFVVNPFKKFKGLRGSKGAAESHQNSALHRKCYGESLNFLSSLKNPENSITAKFAGSLKNNLIKSKKGLIEIIKTIKFLIAKDLPLRGHMDSGLINVSNIYSKN